MSLSAFDRLNVTDALEHLWAAHDSLEAVRPRDASAVRRLERQRSELGRLIETLSALVPAAQRPPP